MSNSEFIKQYTVNDDGTLNPISISSFSELTQDNVFIIVEENARKIFIWKGEKAPVRRKFISAKAAQQMRAEEYGMVYRIESLDPGLEGSDFLSIFGITATEAPEIDYESDLATVMDSVPAPAPTMRPTPAPAVTPQPAPKIETVPKSVPISAETMQSAVKSTPKPVPATITPTESRPAPAARVSAPVTPSPKPTRVVKETEVVVTEPVRTSAIASLDEIKVKLKELEIPQNMEREIIIVGNVVFSVIKEHLALFSKDVVKLEPMNDLPAGIFPASDYQVRLFIEKEKVMFVELLRRKTRSEREEFVDDMRKSLQDLSKLGL
ncbi:MAG: hypothetical protein EAX86_07835 [Candidatus Heimdallarchaeota archaeon]|nr:hypothetical protein [Candidatus Heimdallarchaeota archaeon]